MAAYNKAKQSYQGIQPPNSESLTGIQRCQDALAHINQYQQRVSLEKYNSVELFENRELLVNE